MSEAAQRNTQQHEERLFSFIHALLSAAQTISDLTDSLVSEFESVAQSLPQAQLALSFPVLLWSHMNDWLEVQAQAIKCTLSQSFVSSSSQSRLNALRQCSQSLMQRMCIARDNVVTIGKPMQQLQLSQTHGS